MIDTILQRIISKEVPEEECAVLLSGGMDSISVALTANRLGKKVHAYTFHLEGEPSYDSEKARQVASKFGWEIKVVEVPKTNLEEEWLQLWELFRCEKKTHFECSYPLLYIFPHIKEKKILTGLGADGWYGISKKAILNKKYGVKKSSTRFDLFRSDHFNSESIAGHIQMRELAEYFNKELVTPYIEHQEIEGFFMSKDWDELNRGETIAGSQQKQPVRKAFRPELEKIGKVDPHRGLQKVSKISELFDSILENTDVNYLGRQRLMDVCRDWKELREVYQVFDNYLVFQSV